MGKVCIVALIGKRKSEIRATEEMLEKEKVIDNCVIVASSSSDSAGEVFLTPYTAMSIAEYFRDLGRDTLVILDDMTTHAKYYREISLLAGRFPGRESYPGDIFHIQSEIVERAGNFKIGSREVSITLLPVAETLDADLTGYIQTNLMSMTDGHIFFDSNLFFKGIRPAVNIFLSVTRVGRQTQPKENKEASIEILKILKKKEELERFLKFGPEVTNEVKDIFTKGEAIWNFFRQGDYKPITTEEQLRVVTKILK
jgi:F-type H+-transporting ATPase subunit alpha